MEDRLGVLTGTLIKLNGQILKTYEETKKSGLEGDFYNEVKPFADEVKAASDDWKELALKWYLTHRPKNFHSSQIESVHDHIGNISIQAFYPQTSRAKFLHASKSIDYNLSVLMESIKQQ